MKKQITVCFYFKGVGHSYITIYTPDYPPYRQDIPGCHTFYLAPDTYILRAEGNVEIAGASIEVKDETGNQLLLMPLGTGYFSNADSFTVA
jgi:hypothetical protein